MKPNFDYGGPLLKNEAKFQDPFFSRFHLREAPAPFQLDEKISKSYLFPIFYADVTCAIGIFMCDYAKAQVIMKIDRKSTRLNSSHSQISYAVFCLKKKKTTIYTLTSADQSLPA